MVPVIIIGAPRSGTNILRDSISSFNNISTWNCDEIPYIWSYGNERHPTDLFTKNMCNVKIRNYIKKQFAKISKKNNCEFVLEKTCSNSLRVPFVDEVFPKAKFIFIYRNGIDASYSIMQRWQSDFNLIYSLKKLKYVPKKSLMYFGIKFLKNRYYKMTKANRLKYWGPRFTDKSDILEQPIEVISSMQWAKCVELSKAASKNLDKKRFLNINYENLVENAEEKMIEICKFIGIEFDKNIVVPKIHKKSIGKGLRMLSQKQLKLINPIVSSIE